MGGYGWISLTTDYGTADGFVAACHGVIARIAPEVRVLDVTHEVPPADVDRGAAVLAQTVAHLPSSVHVAVVDPGVGTARRGIAITTEGGVLVGPDNGLLPWAAEALGGIDAVTELTNEEWFLGDVSRTFHGRDIFAPVAARIAAGAPVGHAGPAVDHTTVVRLADPIVAAGDKWLKSEVLTIDRFGNVQLAADGAMLADLGPELVVGDVPAQRGVTFADALPGELVVLIDSAGKVAVAVNGGRAAEILTATPGDVLRITTR